MLFKRISAALITAAALYVANADAVGILIPSANRTDMVHDAARSTIYITEGGNVLRYHTPSATFLSPIILGGKLAGIDISPDGTTLVVADRSTTATDQWVYLVRLSDLTVTKAIVTKEFMEDGTWAVAFGSDGTVFASSGFAGSGWVPTRRLNTATLTWSKLGAAYPENSFSQNAMLSASGDGKVIALAESNNSAGPWGRFDIPTGQLKRMTDYQTGTSHYNFEIATNRNGSQYAIPTYFGAYVYNSAYTKVATIGEYAGPQPIGVAYHPVENLIYFPWSQTREVRIYDSVNFTQVGTYDFEDNFQSTGNGAFVQGRTRLSKDGSMLMVTVTGGVRLVQMYEPLTAAPVTGSVNRGGVISLPLKGAIGNAGTLSYAIASAPLHGTVIISGASATYTPEANFVGTDTFGYTTMYGGASAMSTASIKINQVNRAPVAVADNAKTTRNISVTIPVLTNDYDPDGDVLNIAMVTKPMYGTVAIQTGKIVFTPARNFVGTAVFTYSISDNHGGTATAQVNVAVSRN
ncbi:MAG: Ig-like domain-containing protein [Pseudomonadota bacterium]